LAIWETNPQCNGGKVSFTTKDRQIKSGKKEKHNSTQCFFSGRFLPFDDFFFPKKDYAFVDFKE
jgi:hypothetical protein